MKYKTMIITREKARKSKEYLNPVIIITRNTIPTSRVIALSCASRFMLVSGMMADEQKMSGTFCSQNSCLHERTIYDDRETF